MDNSTGKLGESHIAKYLENKGYKILKRNYHCRFGEIDIIAANEQFIAFVEVKTRKKDSLVSPFEAITPQKRQKIVLTAGNYITEHLPNLQPRFDSAAVFTENGKIVGEEYLESAFFVGEN